MERRSRMAIKRRHFLAQATTASAAVAVSALAKPAIAQQRMEWKMVTSWPKGLAGLSTGAERLAQRIGDISGGGSSPLKVYAAGELVPALQVLDAVSSGTAEMGHDASYYHIGKAPAAGFIPRCHSA